MSGSTLEQIRGFWLLSRYDDVRSAAINWRDYTSSVPGVTAIPVITPRTEPQLPIEIDPPRHSRYRALVNPVFAPQRIAAITPRVKMLARSLFEKMIAAGKAEAVAEFCVPVAITSLAAFTDVPLQDSDKWVGWITSMFNVNDPSAGATASRGLNTYIETLIAARRAKPTGDFVSMLIAAEIDGERLDDIQIRSFMTVVFGAGFETTADAPFGHAALAGRASGGAGSACKRTGACSDRGGGVPAPFLADRDFRPQCLA